MSVETADKDDFDECESREAFRVSRGKHKSRVRAIDLAGNEDPSPAKYEFKRTKAKKKG